MSANIIVNKQLTGNLCLSVTNHDASLVLNVTGDYNAYLVEVLISRATCMPNDELSSISIPNLHQEVSRILHKWCQNFPPTFLLIDIYPQSMTNIHHSQPQLFLISMRLYDYMRGSNTLMSRSSSVGSSTDVLSTSCTNCVSTVTSSSTSSSNPLSMEVSTSTGNELPVCWNR